LHEKVPLPSQGHLAAEPPLKGFAQNQLWCEIAVLACELLALTQLLALADQACRREPKRLRLFSAACGGGSPSAGSGPAR
jgi:hypothetical protein